jgi:hypothetical protein
VPEVSLSYIRVHIYRLNGDISYAVLKCYGKDMFCDMFDIYAVVSTISSCKLNRGVLFKDNLIFAQNLNVSQFTESACALYSVLFKIL